MIQKNRIYKFETEYEYLILKAKHPLGSDDLHTDVGDEWMFHVLDGVEIGDEFMPYTYLSASDPHLIPYEA